MANKNICLQPSAWLRSRRLGRILSQGYPVYNPPNLQWEKKLPKEKVQENFDYFMNVRLSRVNFLNKWFYENFDLDVSLSKDGVDRLTKWYDDYAGVVFAAKHTKSFYWDNCYRDYDPAWEGPYVGINLLFDIGIWAGEYIIAKAPSLYWAPNSGDRRERQSLNHPGFGKPYLFGFSNNRSIQIIFSIIQGFQKAEDKAHFAFKTTSKYANPHSHLRYEIQSTLKFYRWTEGPYRGDPSNEQYW